MEWRELASCVGQESDIFFNEHRLDEAKRFCDGCSVKEACLDEGIWTRSVGTWGGTTRRQRMTIASNSRTYAASRDPIQFLTSWPLGNLS